MKATDLQARKLKLIELFMRVNDVRVINKLHAILIEETTKKQKGSVITDELLEELDRDWEKYKKGELKLYTPEQSHTAARRKLKDQRKK